MEPHVFVAEKNDGIRRAFAKLLRVHGYHVTTAGSARLARERLADCKPVDLILLGVDLSAGWPERFGEQLLEREVDRSVPIVLVASGPEMTSTDVPAGLEPAGLLAKPIGPNQLLTVVERHLAGAG